MPRNGTSNQYRQRVGHAARCLAHGNALPLLRRNIPDRRRELCVRCGINGPVLDLGARRILAEEIVALPVRRWPDGPGNKPAATIWTDVTQDTLNARCAERTFVSTDARFERARWQGLVAVFACRAQLEHGVRCRLTSPIARPREGAKRRSRGSGATAG